MTDNVLGFPHGRRPGDYIPCDIESPCAREGNGLETYVAQNPAPDPVNHPAHYNRANVETIDIIEHVITAYPNPFSYHIGNVLKYLSRAPYKGTFDQDIEKAHWYLSRMVRMLRDSNGQQIR